MDALKHVGDSVLQMVLPILATIIATYLIAWLRTQAAKAGIELTDAQTAALKTDVIHAVQAVDEQARRTTMQPEDKRRAAVAMIQQARPDALGDDIHKMIDAVLPEVRAKLVPSVPRLLSAEVEAMIAADVSALPR